MAVTKIWPVKDSLARVVDYAQNPDKTIYSDLQNVLHYAANGEKTIEGGERAMFVTGVNCNRDTAFQEMQAVKERFGKTGGNVAYHAYQSFKPGEVTPELCHRLGVELAKRMWGDEYQVLVATHFNTGTYEKRFAQEQMERFGLREKKELTARGRELDKAKQRVVEIDQLIQKSYEDMSKGLLSEERFATLSVSLEAEQKQLKAAIPEMEISLEATTDRAADLQRFIDRARQVTRLTELTPEIVNEFIEKIVVSKPDKLNGKRHQRVDIYYNTIGLWCAPSPEEMEKLFQKHLSGQRKKTA